MNKKLIALLFVAGLGAVGSSINAGKARDGLRAHFKAKMNQYQKNIDKLTGYIMAGEKLLTSGKTLSAHQLKETNKTISKNRLRLQRQRKMIDQLKTKLSTFFDTSS